MADRGSQISKRKCNYVFLSQPQITVVSWELILTSLSSSSSFLYSNRDVSRLWTRPDTSRLSNSKWCVPVWDWLLFLIPLHYKRRMQESFKRLLLICSVTFVMITWIDLLDRNIEYLYLGSRRDVCQRNPCHNGGTCSQTSFEPGYRCRCEGTGYYGNRCQHGKTWTPVLLYNLKV
jgi:EGF-like domain.